MQQQAGAGSYPQIRKTSLLVALHHPRRTDQEITAKQTALETMASSRKEPKNQLRRRSA